MEISLKDIKKSLGGRQILNGIELEFQPGAINVIIGPNGAGKTTLLSIVGLMEKPDSGKLIYDSSVDNGECIEYTGHIHRKLKTELRRKIGFVFQNPLMLEGSVYRNMIYGLQVRKREIDKNLVERMLQKVGLEGKSDQDARKLSGGEKQRLQLARVMILEPHVFLLDEPTANLDPMSTRTIETLIAEIAASGKMVVLSTHNLVQARMLGQKFFFLNEGKVIQQGPASEIFQRPVSLDIAEFASVENIIYGRLIKENGKRFLNANGLRIQVVTPLEEGSVAGVIRAEDIILSLDPITSSARNSFQGKITLMQDMGIFLSISVECEGQTLVSFITRESAELMDLNPGKQVYTTFKSTAVHLLPR